MTNLKSAREKGELEKFIKANEAKGNKAQFDATLKAISSPSQKSKPVRGTSKKGSS